MESKKKGSGFFWPSYADLMTSLFFIMLVLFVITVVALKEKQKDLEEEKEFLEEEKKKVEVDAIKFKEIEKMDEQVNKLRNSDVFEYLEGCNKYIVKAFKGKSIFLPLSSIIKDEYIDKTIEVGREIKIMLNELNKSEDTTTVSGKAKKMGFYLVIEGNMANTWNFSIPKYDPAGFSISYKRALAVDELWRAHGIDLRDVGAEYIIAGSGYTGECRDEEIEDNNKRPI